MIIGFDEIRNIKDKFLYINKVSVGPCSDISVWHIPMALRQNIFKIYLVNCILAGSEKEFSFPASEWYLEGDIIKFKATGFNTQEFIKDKFRI